MRIRTEQIDDRDAIRRVHTKAFGDEGATIVELADALRDDTRDSGAHPAALSLVAVEDGDHTADESVSEGADESAETVVGNVVISFGWVDAPTQLVRVGVLSPIGVLPEWQRRGIGAGLIEQAVQQLTERAVPLLFLEGDPDYYPRFGFRTAGELGFGKPSARIPDMAFQVLPLPAYQDWMTGPLIYPDTFWWLDAVGLR